MNVNNLYIGEIFVQEYIDKKIIEKKLGFLPLMYVKEFGTYITLGRHEEIYPEKCKMPLGFRYVKENGIIPYLSFGNAGATNEEIAILIKNKIQELNSSRKEESSIQSSKHVKILSWDEYYDLCLIYYRHHRNLNIKESFKTKNGYEYDANGVRLGVFVCNQRRDYKQNKLSEDKINRLECIGMKFNITTEEKYNIESYEQQWYEKYKLACAYYEHYGNSNISTYFRTFDGITYSKDGICLGAWVQRQKNAYKNGKLSEERIKLLTDINMKLSNDEKNKTRKLN